MDDFFVLNLNSEQCLDTINVVLNWANLVLPLVGTKYTHLYMYMFSLRTIHMNT